PVLPAHGELEATYTAKVVLRGDNALVRMTFEEEVASAEETAIGREIRFQDCGRRKAVRNDRRSIRGTTKRNRHSWNVLICSRGRPDFEDGKRSEEHTSELQSPDH